VNPAAKGKRFQLLSLAP